MLIHYTKELSDEKLQKDIKELLVKYDNSFIPALSSRSSTTQSRLIKDEGQDNGRIDEYFTNLMNQSFLLAVKNGKALGFMSFIEDKELYYGSKQPGNYVSTVIVDEELRGMGLTKSFYQALMTKNKNITTRTWNTNFAHIKILQKLGFEEVEVIENDRGHNLDTVYYELLVS